MTFLLIILISGNVYQYIERNNREDSFMEENKRLNQVIHDSEQRAIDYERIRSEKLEYLLSNLSKSVDNQSIKK